MSNEEHDFLAMHDAVIHVRPDGRVYIDVERDDGLRVQCNAATWSEAVTKTRRLVLDVA